MSRRLMPLIARHEPKGRKRHHFKAAIGATAGIALIGGLAILTHLPLLFAPFGATAVLVFGQPSSPLAQPANVVGGYLLATALAVLIMVTFPDVWWMTALAVGASIGLMAYFRITHPPAGAVPIVAYASTVAPGTLVTAVLVGAVALVATAIAIHRVPPRQIYPRPLE